MTNRPLLFLRTRPPWAGLFLLASACTGQVMPESKGPGTDSQAGDQAPPAAPLPKAPGCESSARFAGASPIRRLTRFEYNRTVADLLGDNTAPAGSFPAEEKVLGFDNNGTSDVSIASSTLVAAYQGAAEALALKAAENLEKLMGCSAAETKTDGCARSFVTSFGRRAYRRPLTKAEETKAVDFFLASRAAYGEKIAARMFIEATLQSPHFLYRIEGQEGTGTTALGALSGYELASRLSYLLWGSMPDTELLAAAA